MIDVGIPTPWFDAAVAKAQQTGPDFVLGWLASLLDQIATAEDIAEVRRKMAVSLDGLTDEATA